MRARLSPRLHPHTLRVAARSALLPLPVLLVVRVLVTAVLAGHTTLFSATGSYQYSSFSVWANALLLLSMLSLSLSSLLELVTDDDVPSSDPLSLTPSPLYRILPAVAIPLMQTAGSGVMLAAIVHWIFARTKVPQVTEAMYATFALHLLNPFIFMLDLFLVVRPDTRILYIPISYLLSVCYILFSFCMLRIRHINFLSDVSRHGTRGIVAALALTLLTPVAVYALTLLPITVGAKCMLDDADTESGKPYDEEMGTDVSSEISPELKVDGELECGSSTHTRGNSSEKETIVRIDSATEAAAVVGITPDAIRTPCRTPRGSPHRSPERLSKRASARSNGDRETSVRSLSTRLSLRSSMHSTVSATSSGGSGEERGERRNSTLRQSVKRASSIGSAVFPRSMSEGSTAWSDVDDVVVDVGAEYFRMPGSGSAEAVRLPPRVAAARTTGA